MHSRFCAFCASLGPCRRYFIYKNNHLRFLPTTHKSLFLYHLFFRPPTPPPLRRPNEGQSSTQMATTTLAGRRRAPARSLSLVGPTSALRAARTSPADGPLSSGVGKCDSDTSRDAGRTRRRCWWGALRGRTARSLASPCRG